MKKILALLLTVALFATLFVGCAADKPTTEAPAPDAPVADAPVADAPATEAPAADAPAEASNLEKSLALDPSGLTGSDGQKLLIYGEARDVPEKPTDEDGALMWEMEYAGRQTPKEPMIPSPGDGIIGKKIIMIAQSEHPYWTAIGNGFKAACEFYQCSFEIWNPNGDLNQQNQYVDKAIAEDADMVLLAALDQQAAVQQFKKLYEAGVPAIAFNMVPNDEAMKYVLGITAPDDFGQFKMLAEYLAKEQDGKAGVCYMTHIPGGSPYYARYLNVANYYAANYPDMKALDFQSPGFDAPKCKQVVADWITRFGDELTCIVLADDSAQALGTSQALEEAGRTDIKVIAAGNSKVGMDLVAQGKMTAITYQSAEADGAVPVKLAADYFNGLDIGSNPAYYLPQAVINGENVAQYEPAQW